MKRSQLAINSISTRHKNLEEMLDAYAAAGFRNVEFALGHVREELKTKSLGDVKAMLDAREMKCIGGFEGTLEAFGNDEARAKNREFIQDGATLLQGLGGTNLVVGTDGPQKAGEDSLQILARTSGEVAASIENTGVSLCIEFNWSPLVKSLRTAAQIARMSGAPNVGVLFDPAHFHCTPTKFDQINAANVPFIKHVHVDDMNDKPGELSDCNSDRALPGEGILDLRAMFGEIEKFGYDGYFSIEMFSEELWNLSAHEAAAKMYQSLLPLCDD